PLVYFIDAGLHRVLVRLELQAERLIDVDQLLAVDLTAAARRGIYQPGNPLAARLDRRRVHRWLRLAAVVLGGEIPAVDRTIPRAPQARGLVPPDVQRVRAREVAGDHERIAQDVFERHRPDRTRSKRGNALRTCVTQVRRHLGEHLFFQFFRQVRDITPPRLSQPFRRTDFRHQRATDSADSRLYGCPPRTGLRMPRWCKSQGPT